MFADDLKVALRVRGQGEVDIIQETLSSLYHWCIINCMELNISKCHVVTFHRNKTPILATYNINGQALIRREQVRDLGVTFEKDMRFVSHIQNIRSKALRMLGFIFRNTQDFSDVTTLKTLYFAYVRSVLEYCSVVWSPYYKCHNRSLETIQHKFLKIVAFKTRYIIPNHDYSEIESKHNIPTLETRRQLHDLEFLYKLINCQLFCPDLLNQISLKVPIRPTRQKTLFRLKTFKTNIDKYSALQRCQFLWNVASDGGFDIFSDPPSRILNILPVVLV